MGRGAGRGGRAMSRARWLTMISVAVVAVMACRAGRAPTALPALPDLMGLDSSLQQQVRGEYEALEHVARTGDAPDVADAHGRVGKLLLAAERYEGAGAFFRAAAARNARDMRWPYYLGHVHRSLQQPETAAMFVAEAH